MGLPEERLRKLRKEGKPIELVIFSDTDHGMMEFIEAADGRRTYTRFTEGYYRLLFDWIKERQSTVWQG